ncbi:carbohydrate binding family 9 domain-containing protein [Corallococcus sp. Z5C101001]|uniref:carbohydrate binding family 9 domain-containing protein n=1 Tax=Corallococcus sp. Z5C101001 TaxID=2596829 RepID=UPI00117FC62B|nr:carbohydrate binding family 9 domain-containing protein [Corallococcus sp. Z5C101001]TSC34427.1 carbohydrate binding family 9 domain-containing protein [Corallococcus sp. Z5C101001]
MRARSRVRRAARGAALLAIASALLVPHLAMADTVSTSQPPARPSLQAIRTHDSPRLDGVLDDPVWSVAAATDAFTQKFPNEGQSPSEHTLLRLVYDDDALYVAFECEQLKTPRISRLVRRDRKIGDDRVEVTISDGTRTFEFWVSAAGVMGDGIRFNDTDYSADWDGVWDARVHQHATGWSAELRIPLLIFQLDPEKAGDWGLQARRYLSSVQETQEWAYIPRTVAGETSRYGRLSRLEGLHRGNPFELRPFALLRAARGVDGRAGYGATGGLDARVHLTPNVGLDLTVNPDFAQVEADEQVLNLTTIETFFPEKRPFFLDGMDMFQMPRMTYFPTSRRTFYTRRIGAVPTKPGVLTQAPESERVTSIPVPTTIYGAAKLRGTLGTHLNWGLLSALTGQNDVQVERADLSLRDALAAPRSAFTVGRMRAVLSERAQLGLLATATQRLEPTGEYPLLASADSTTSRQLCPGGERVAASARCFHDSYVMSADGSWRSLSGDYVVSGQALMSAIQNGPPRTLPDGTVIASGDVDAGALMFAAKEGGNWLGSVEAEASGRRLDFNDLGFMVRQNHLRLLPTVEYRAVDPFAAVAEVRVRLSTSFRNTVDGLNVFRGYYAFTEWQFKNAWKANTMVYYFGNRYEDREVGDGTAIERTGSVGWDLTLTSAPGRRLSGSLTSVSMFRDDGYSLTYSAQLGFHLLPQLELQVLPQVTLAAGEARYLGATPRPGEYLFGRLDARSIGATLRANYTLTTRLTLQLYAQTLLVARHYRDFGSFTPDHARANIRLDDLTAAEAPTKNPDSQLATLDVNAVLRWEFRPGSTMFLVYTRSQAPARVLASGERAELDLGALRDIRAADALWMKASYWWN